MDQDGWMDGWMNGWMDGWMDGWINGRLRSALFWDITPPRVVIVYQRFGTDALSRNVSKQLPHDAA
jgi:hypothetical protein